MQLHELLLSEADKSQLHALAASRAQSLLFNADRGYGKRTIAVAFADELVGSRPEYMTLLEPVDGSITIDSVRRLKSFFALKTHLGGTWRAAVIVDADCMTLEAQNSLLKLLEEPPENCALILTSSHPENLLGTIRSRAQTVHLRAPSHEQVESYCVSKGYRSVDVSKAMAMTAGLVGATCSLLGGEDSMFTVSLEKAKELLGQKHVDRLKQVDALAKDRQSTMLVLDALKTIATASLKSSSSQQDLWRRVLRSSSTAQQQLSGNANSKLVLTNLFLSL